MAISPRPKRSHAAGKGLTISVKTFVLPRLTVGLNVPPH